MQVIDRGASKESTILPQKIPTIGEDDEKELLRNEIGCTNGGKSTNLVKDKNITLARKGGERVEVIASMGDSMNMEESGKTRKVGSVIPKMPTQHIHSMESLPYLNISVDSNVSKSTKKGKIVPQELVNRAR